MTTALGQGLYRNSRAPAGPAQPVLAQGPGHSGLSKGSLETPGAPQRMRGVACGTSERPHRVGMWMRSWEWPGVPCNPAGEPEQRVCAHRGATHLSPGNPTVTTPRPLSVWISDQAASRHASPVPQGGQAVERELSHSPASAAGTQASSVSSKPSGHTQT
ncbi:hypothetical protein P7K49_003288 [Saguinus oedipus]|uniref:Uncharacterized protein n=1 Tax=Saguinus oedipus TaxID=9490 RepID=A0ABQ9WJS4_SAGOE|nr:hypothetical protein P7K49_003288 [Saguinus oedipus]